MSTKIDFFKNCKIGKIEKEVFGSFIEHMGRAVYGGIYEPNSKYADEKGFRTDVIELVKELGVSTVRYPGGNFLSGYDWKDGIGDKKDRKVRLDLAWAQLEPNEVGVLEFNEWARLADTEIMMGVNMGTGTAKDAAELVEYCNYPKGSAWSDKRIADGCESPLAVSHWCIGNEMDGNWQICALTAQEYGRKAVEAAKMMKWVDPSLKLTVCGSSGPTMPTYPEWDRIVLEHTYDQVEYLSLHKYYGFPDNDQSKVSDFLASFVDFDAFIKTGKATIEYVKAYNRSKKQIYISVDEWNVWNATENDVPEERWVVGARRGEVKYTALDAVVFSSLMMTLINNADCVKMGCLAQLINVLAPIFVDGEQLALKQSIFYPFACGTHYAKGWALRPFVETEEYRSELYGETPYVYSAASYDEESGEITIFLVNNRIQENESVEICLNGFDNLELIDNERLYYNDIFDKNTFQDREKVKMGAGEQIVKNEKGNYETVLPPISFSMIRFKRK